MQHGRPQPDLKFGTESVRIPCKPTFKVVGIELGATDRLATVAHFAPRLVKALQPGRRLAALDVSTAVAEQI